MNTHPLVVYKASAGSGKTFTLAVQYIKLLVLTAEGREYAHILAVTFTNKATAEMKDRILSQLYGIGHSLASSNPYFQALKKALQEEGVQMADDELRRLCRQALSQILHDYNRFRVQTIDAFFQMVLRGMAHELGLTANLQVEISDTEVLSKAVDRIVDRLHEDPQVLEWLYSLVRDRIDNDQRWDVTREVKDFGRAIFNEDYLMRGDRLRLVLSDPQQMRALIKRLDETEQTSVEIVQSLGHRLEETVSSSGFSYTDFSFGGTLEKFVKKLLDGDLDVEVGSRIRGWIDDPIALVKKADRNNLSLMEVADAVGSLLDEVVHQLDTLSYNVNSARLARAHLKPLCLLDAIDREVAAINAETSRFNLAKTPILLSRMVGESDAPFIFEKIGAQLHHVMIDEFQDTSRLQWHNFRVLLLESYAKGGRNLLVGDVKQSIYRWRGGDWRVLGNIEHEMEPKPHVEPLDVNRRSARQIITFNNEFFDEAVRALDRVSAEDELTLGEPFSFAAAYSDVIQQVPEGKPESGYVSIQMLPSVDYKRREDWEPAILDSLKQEIRSLHDQHVPYSQMTILVRKNSEMAPIIQSFAEDEAWEDKPLIVSDEAFLLSASPAVNLLIAALRVLDNPDDLVSAYYLRHAQIPALADGLDPALAEMPLYELLEALYRLLDIDTFAHQDAYLFGFFDAVMDFLHNEASDIHSFLSYWDERLSRQAIPAGEVDGIRIISIHKSKGLQFHTVFMPFCTWSMERDRAGDLLWCKPKAEPYDQLQLLPITPNARTAPRSVFAHDYVESHLLSRLDELNALYVGFTRAKANLYAWAVGSPEGLQGGNRTVGDLIADVLPEGAILGEPVTQLAAVDDERENRLVPVYEPLDVKMQSFPVRADFRQSNRSQQFLASLQDTTDEIEGSEYSRANQYIELGRLLHSVLQQIATTSDVPRVLDALEHEGVIARYAADGSYVSVPRLQVERWFANGLKDPTVASWFDGSWTLFNECGIIHRDPVSGSAVKHRPDRVMMSADASHIVVVDFKFGHYRTEYDDQVRLYMDLLRQMHPAATVEGYLWFVYASRIQRVPATAPASQQLTLEF